jgi:hypothetical protein
MEAVKDKTVTLKETVNETPEMTVADMLNLSMCMNNVLNNTAREGVSIPSKLGYAFNRNSKIMKPFIDSFNEQKQSLFDKYAEKDENGKLKTKPGVQPNSLEYIIPDDKREAFHKESIELALIKEKINLYKVSIKELEAITAKDKDGNIVVVKQGFTMRPSDGSQLIMDYLITD